MQSRTVVVEHLPEDHSHQNLEKIFRVAGRFDLRRISSVSFFHFFSCLDSCLTNLFMSRYPTIVNSNFKMIQRKYVGWTWIRTRRSDTWCDNLEKTVTAYLNWFQTVINRVKTVRVCHPQEPNSSRSKGDFFVSNKVHYQITNPFCPPKFSASQITTMNSFTSWFSPFFFFASSKLHALVEYETTETAEKAVC